ncbi:hypothetical protein PoB_002123900 [Plakobranchus ocellatus]|uniref:PID domain-containing protein n=1 Tax=Plakobranchus ocellatus TaxID=259542 RepID=A0AAV3ZLI1_9GAST|nr:hypothetical protein PoB_002123900 [Plakobranchus ocellatus]
MAAAVAEIAAGASTLAADGDGYTNASVAWDTTTTEDAIEHALSDDPDLLSEISNNLETNLALSPDRNLNVEDDEESLTSDSAGGLRDSDTASNSSSVRDIDENSVSNGGGEEISPRKGSLKSVITINQSASISSQVAQVKDERLSPKASGAASRGKSSSPSSSSGSVEKKPSTTKNGGVELRGSSRRSSVDESAHDKRKHSILSATLSETDSVSSGGKTGTSSSKNPLKLLKRLSKFDKNSKKEEKPQYKSEFSAVVIDRLPQVFVAKYLGHRPVKGVCGLQHVRKPVDQMVREVKDKLNENAQAQLPLLYVVISPKGIDLREHKRNKIKDVAPIGMFPVDFISYGVQDIKFWRVFTCIVVENMSSQSRTRTANCHAFLCDSAYNGRKMALSLGAAFGIYSKKLQASGLENNFRVELRPPDEIADEIELDV